MEPQAATGQPLVITADEALLADLMRLCAAANATPQVVADPDEARADWWRAPCVLVGSDRAEDVAGRAFQRRSDVWLVSRDAESAALWRLGVEIGADRVVLLPVAQGWLVERLSDAVDTPTARALTVGVVGGRGGAGASTLAAGLALRAARANRRVLLIDADPLGGGIELLLGCEAAGGLRWPEVAATQGRVTATALREALPGADGVAVLSWDRGDESHVEPAAMRAMIGAGQRGSDVVLIDLPRRLDDAAVEAVVLSDVVLLICTGDVRVAASAERQLATLRLLCGDIRLVVRQSSGGDVCADDLAAALRLPLAAEIASQRGLARSVNEGLGPVARGRLGSQCSRLLEALARPRVAL
jgi:secretion/DNA translocation related CpaE-like protein